MPETPIEENPFTQFATSPTQTQQVDQQGKPIEEENPFTKFNSNPGANTTTMSQNQPTAAQQQEQSWYDGPMVALEHLNRSFGRMAEGTLQLGANIGSTLGGGKEMEDYSKSISNFSNTAEQSAQQSAQQHPGWATAGAIAGDTARVIPAIVASGGGGILAQLAKGALANAGVSALDIAPDTATKVKNIMEGGALGMLGTGAGMLAGTALKGIGMGIKNVGGTVLDKIVNPKEAVIKHLANEVKIAPGGFEAVKNNGKDLLTELTPAEQIGTASAKEAEGKVYFANDKIKTAVGIKENARQGLLKDVFDKSVDDFTPKGEAATKAEADAAFENLRNYKLTPEQMDPLVKNDTLNKYVGAVAKDQVMPENLKNLDFNNVAKLNSVKKALQDDMWSKTSGEAKTLNSDNLTAMREARNILYKTLDEATGGKYAEANKLAQQGILKNRIIDELEDIKGVVKWQDASPKQIYDKLFPNPKRVNVYLDMVKEAGGDVETASKLINTLNKLNKSIIPKMIERPSGVPHMWFGGKNIGIAQRAILKFTEGRYNKAYAKMLYENKWQSQVSEILSKGSDVEKAVNLATFLSTMTKTKATTIGIANQGKGYLDTISQIQPQQEENNGKVIGKPAQ